MAPNFGYRIGDLTEALSAASGDDLEVSLAGSLGSRKITLLNLFLSLLSLFGFYAVQPTEIAAQVVSKWYPFGHVYRYGATGNGSTDDTAAIQNAVTAVVANGGGTIRFPKGTYKLTAAINFIQVRDIIVKGDGRFSTVIKQYTANTPAFQINGMWYSRFEGLQFTTAAANSANGVFELDGNYDGTHTLGVQANTFKDCLFDASGISEYAFAMGRRGGGSAQGSENLFLNCHFSNAIFANYYQNGFNALQNTFIGGNHQGHQTHGIYILAGQIVVFSVGFQSTWAYTQILNDGFDINANSGGVSDRIVIIGCRTESARFYRGGASQPPVLIGNYQNYAGDVGWFASRAYTLNQTAIHTSATKGPQMYVVTTAGTSGGTQPTWPDSGTVTDGSVVWTLVTVYPIDIANGSVVGDWGMSFGFFRNAGFDFSGWSHEVNTDYTANSMDNYILVDATAANRTITLPTPGKGGRNARRIIVQKHDSSSHTVTVQSDDTALLGTIPGGAPGSLEVLYQGGAIVANRYRVVAQNYADPTFRRVFVNQGSNVVAGDFALSGGFGSTATISSAAGKDARGQVTISSSGTGQAANPTVTLTYHDGTWTSAPFVVASRAGGNQKTVPFEVTTISATQVILTFLGTPVAGESYTLNWIAVG